MFKYSVLVKRSFVLFALSVFIFPMSSLLAETTLKFSTAAPKGTPWVTHAENSAKNLMKNSGGSMKMEVFPAAQLGAEVETIKQTARGRLDVGTFSITAAAATVPEVNLLVSPFFWNSFEQAECAVDNHLLVVFDELFSKKGLKIIQWQELGWQILFAKKKITEPSQIKGYKMRVAPAKNSDILWKAIGSSGVPLPFVETHSAIQTGLINGGELPAISYIASGLGKVAPHMTRTNHIYQPSIMLMSTRSWKKLSKKEQAIFMKSMESAQSLRVSVRKAINFFEDKHVKEGGFIHDLTPAQRKAWSDIYTEKHQNELIAEIGGEAQAVYDKVLGARKACNGG